MAVMFQREPRRSKPTATPKKDYPKAPELRRASRLSVAWRPGEYLRLTFVGPCAKFPSVTNNRLTMIPKGSIMKLLCMLKQRPNRQLVERAIGEFGALRAVTTKNPAHMEVIAACTQLWMDAQPKNFGAFKTDIDDRLFLFVLCDELLRQHDTHNILKAACDWAQDVGIVRNDRHVDALALRSADFLPNHHGTIFLFLPHAAVHNNLVTLLTETLSYGKDQEHFGEAARLVSAQRSLGL